MGSKIIKLKPIGGFCAETGAALTLAYVTLTGTPVSTTHTMLPRRLTLLLLLTANTLE